MPEPASKYAILTLDRGFTARGSDVSIPRLALPERRPYRNGEVAEFNKEQLMMFERLLLNQKKELLQETVRAVQEMNEPNDSFADPTDRASWESESTRDLRIRDRERKLLEKIDQALQRIVDGTFGECEECGDMISVGRLRARPVTTLCIQCKAEQEAKELKPNFNES
jgi:DnaK suppressor protein